MTKTQEEIIFYPNKIIFEDGQKYLYNFITNGLFLLDDISLDILRDKVRNESEYIETIQSMKDNFIIKTDDNDAKLEELYNKISINKKAMNPSSLVLMISQECNLRCTYCYGTDGEYNHKGLMSEETAKKAIDYFVKYSKGDKLNICFFGGEPLLNFKLIKKVVCYAKELENETGKEITFSMTTNATLINREIENFIIENKISCTISIDGHRKTQNTNRFYANKQGCYDDVIKNTEKLRNTNLLTVRVTVTPHSTNMLENIDHLIDKGFKRIAWAPALNLLSSEDMEKIIDNQKKIINKVGQYIADGNYKRARKYGTIIDLLKKLDKDGLRTKSCGTGTNIMAVDIEGKIYPCHRFVGNEYMELGNVYNNEVCKNNDFYLHVGLKEFSKCQSCISRNVCGGGCIHENFEVNQDIRVAPEIRCKFFIEIAQELIKVYIRLDEQMKKELFGEYKYNA